MHKNSGFITTATILVIAGAGILAGIIGGYFYPWQQDKVGAPTQSVRLERSLNPETTDKWEMGTTTKRWLNSFVKYASTTVLSAADGSATTTITSATSTFANGISLTAGCFRDVGGSCVTTGTAGASTDWNKQLNYAVLNLTPTTTIPIWAKDAIYASSTLIVAGNTTLSQATSTNLYSTTLGLNSEYFTDLTGTGLQNTIGALTLNATGDWTGTIDLNDFAGGAIGAGDLLYGASAGSITELGIGTNGYVLTVSNNIPAWIATTSIPLAGDVTGTLSVSVVGDDSHAHTGVSLSLIDISADTNLTGGLGLTLTDDDMLCDTGSASAFGCLLAAEWTVFNNKVSSSSIDTFAELDAVVADQALAHTGSAMTGTFDSNNFDGGAVASGDLLYGSGVGTIAELTIGTNGNLLAVSNGLPAWIASSTMPFAAKGANSDITSLAGLTTALTVAQGGTGAGTHTLGNLLVGAGTSAITSTTTANLKASMFLNLVENTALTTWAGSANITTIGTITSGGLGNNSTILNGTSPTVDVVGEIAIDTTSDQLIYYGGSKRILVGNQYPTFTYSTSTAWTGSTTIPLGTAFVAETWNQVQCYTNVGTLNVSFSDGTNLMNMLNASTTVGTITFTTNNTFTAAEKRQVAIGTPATAPTKISCTISKSITAD